MLGLGEGFLGVFGQTVGFYGRLSRREEDLSIDECEGLESGFGGLSG